MSGVLWLVKFVLLVLFSRVEGYSNPSVYLDNEDFKGSLEGVEKVNILNETFSAFLGIPYAKAPLGPLRFRDPQQLERFEGTFQAKHEGYECHSITATNASEDCLYLNVYSKRLNSSQVLPVVIMIHPGGLYLGSSKWMDPSYLMTKDLVLVTFNYRLGSLGFLNLGSEQIPGNAGFKDQVYAMRWVKRNIGEFGGNPQDVTLMGYSAGSLSVSLHLVSPMSKGLFHKAIVMSGAMPPQIKMPRGNQRYLAVRQAKRLNCSRFQEVEEINWSSAKDNALSDFADINDDDILSCLSKFTGKEIASTLRKMFDFGKDNPIYLWLPVTEKDYGQERFLEQDFYRTLQEVKNKIEIPLLMGYTNGEFCTSSRDILTNLELKTIFENQFSSLAPRIFGFESWKNQKDISEKIINYYFNGSTALKAKDYDSLCDLFSDSLIRFGSHQTAEIISNKGGLVYFYEFQYQSKMKEMDLDFPQKKDRVEHMDDLQYLFNWSQKSNILPPEELEMLKLYTEFIYDFIKNGKIAHTKSRPYPLNYALIGDHIKFVEGRNFDNYKFWLDLFKEE